MESLNLNQSYAVLKLSVSPELAEKYKEHVDAHNKSILSDKYANSGFDLFVPEKTVVTSVTSEMIYMRVKCEMLYKGHPCGYYMFPRSSISKTHLMLANHTGIIDAGYRGELIGAFRNLGSDYEVVEKYTRLLQICHPKLCPIYVIIVQEDSLSSTSRADGGFGSTGK